jgi:glycosyltransferase involved in cell wall biosynthesis
MHGVTTTGHLRVEELGALYRNALAVVQPSLEEGFGLPVVEAMASGTPVICSKIPALVEVAGSAAISVDPRDAGSIAAAMQRVSADAALRRSLTEEGLARAHVFTWERCAERTLEVYREIAAGRTGRS